MTKVRLNFLNLLFLLLLMIIFVKSMKPGTVMKSAPTIGQSSSGVKHEEQVLSTVQNNVEPEEISAVHGNIPAIYIVRVFHKKAKELKALQQETMETVNEKLKEENTKEKVVVQMFNDPQFRDQQMKKQNEKENFVLKLVEDSQFTVEQTQKLVNLAQSLGEEAKARAYLEELDKIMERFNAKLEELKLHKEINAVAFQHQQVNLLDFVHQLRVAYVNFLEQIQLEVKLHLEFPNLLLAFKETAKKLHEFKEKNEKRHADELAKVEGILRDSKLSTKERMRQHQNAAKSAFDVYIEHVELNDVLANLNNAGQKLYDQLLPVFSERASHTVHQHKYVKSILEVAEQAAAEAGSKNANWLDYLAKLVKIWHVAVHTLFPKIPSVLRKEVHAKMHENLEMPREWFLRTQAMAERNEVTDEEEMVHLQVKMLLAKTLLVYERLNKFFMLEYYHKFCKETNYAELNPSPSYALLKMNFAKFDLEMRGGGS